MNSFIDAIAMENSNEVKNTENGMKAWATSDSALVDLFGLIGSSRGHDISKEFVTAMSENADLAVRILLWARDVRGGAGERATFRALLKVLEKENIELAGKIMHRIPELGRFDDLFAYEDPINRKAAFRFYADALMAGNQLAAKWAPRELARSKADTAGKQAKAAVARELRTFMQLSPKEYRQLLSKLTNVVENDMCAKKWDDINFSHVPSLAAARYQKAFGRHAGEKYSEYIRQLQKPIEERDPVVKINSSAVYPYDVVVSLRKGNPAVANAQFDALPNYIQSASILPMIDVSESMMGHSITPSVTVMDVALSLGLYTAHHNTSEFKDMFVTFTNRPTIKTLKGSLAQKIKRLKGPVGYNTNVTAAIETVLRVAVDKQVSPEKMPGVLLIVSDMQFDKNTCIQGGDKTALDMVRSKYKLAGYQPPLVVFWNLAGRASARQAPVKLHDSGAVMISGFSPAIMQSVLGVDPNNFTPTSVMMKAIMSERYDY